MTGSHRIPVLAQRLVDRAAARGLMVAAAESCTGGMLAGAITDIPGASAVFERGFVTYSNAAKSEMLGVRTDLIHQFGAVSQPVAKAMAKGALARSPADLAISITGVAGPSGGSEVKPVGLVWFALAKRHGEIRTERRVFAGGDRNFVRLRATQTALQLLLSGV